MPQDKGTNRKRAQNQAHKGLILPMDFDEAMRRVMRVSPQKPRTTARKKKK
jgi:3-deoxy-D-arabino-heptulosonate 7-phosphate (DAHP) synthase